jgi:hypothetical protein
MGRKCNVEKLDGTTVEVTLNVMTSRKRDVIFKKYLNLSKFMTAGVQSDSIIDLLKNPDDVFEFMSDCLDASMKGLSLEEISGSERDSLFEKNAQYIMGIGEVEAKN